MGKKIGVFLAIVLLLLVIGGAGGYVWYQGYTLRTKIYRPLYQEVVQVQEVVLASSVSRAVPSTVYMSLQKNPLWKQVPDKIRQDTAAAYEKTFDCQSEAVVAGAHYRGLAQYSVALIHKEADDQAWIAKVNAAGPLPAPPTGALKFSRQQAQIDPKDPEHRRRIPGGPYWRMNDWLEYPANVADLDREWGEKDFLFLTDSFFDQWSYRITRDDLRRNNQTLAQFMENMKQTIAAYGRIQAFTQYCQQAIPMVDALKKDLAEKAQ